MKYKNKMLINSLYGTTSAPIFEEDNSLFNYKILDWKIIKITKEHKSFVKLFEEFIHHELCNKWIDRLFEKKYEELRQ